MSGFKEYEAYDALGLAELVRRREVSPGELLEAAIERIEARNPRLNAVVTKLYDAAWLRSREPLRGPFAGVPFLVKDLTLQLEGARITHGSRFWRDQVCTKDSTLKARYKAAGVVTAGVTSTAEYGLSCETAPILFGPTRNPWNLSRTAGGSSGGAAVAVASGMVPAGHASDGGGSIRIPSSCNGVFGLKTSRGRVPLGPRPVIPMQRQALPAASWKGWPPRRTRCEWLFRRSITSARRRIAWLSRPCAGRRRC